MSAVAADRPAEGFDRCASRAAALAEASGAAREPLLFAAALCRAQRDLASRLERLHAEHPFTGRLFDDVDRLLPATGDLLRIVSEEAPEPLRSRALARLGDEPPVARRPLLAYWEGESTSRDDYLSRALIRPYAESLRLAHITPDRIHTEGHCPFCGGVPIVASRSGGVQLEGAVRRLHCSVCGNGWIFSRICCPVCQERTPEKLPIYEADSHDAARIEACDTCRCYVKSIDLTQDAHLIPEIDDLTSIALDLWAAEEGYTRIEPGLAGI